MSLSSDLEPVYDDFGVSAGTPTGCLARMGGLATRRQLIDRTGRGAVEQALRDGAIVRLAPGRYSLPGVTAARQTAHAAGGVLCLTSAALEHGWKVKEVPELPHVNLARGRRLSPAVGASIVVHRFALGPDDVVGMVTSREATLRHCLRLLPEDEALAIGDSAARAGELPTLARVARTAAGPGAPRIRELARQATPMAANPFESVLRCICQRVVGLHVTPQLLITSVTPEATPDLVDRDLKIVIEADSFEWHGGRAALRKDARRYNSLVADGWLVLRFSWEDVMYEQADVLDVLARTVALRTRGYTEVDLGDAATAGLESARALRCIDGRG